MWWAAARPWPRSPAPTASGRRTSPTPTACASSRRLAVGTELIIPIDPQRAAPALTAARAPADGPAYDARGRCHRTARARQLRIKRGDTLAAIASQYGTTVQSLQQWNGPARHAASPPAAPSPSTPPASSEDSAAPDFGPADLRPGQSPCVSCFSRVRAGSVWSCSVHARTCHGAGTATAIRSTTAPGEEVACSPRRSPRPSSASTPIWCGSRPTPPPGFPRFTMVGLPDTAVEGEREPHPRRAAQLRLRLQVGPPHHGQPRPRRPAEGGSLLRSGHRHRPPVGRGRRAAGPRWPRRCSSASWPWTGPCGGHGGASDAADGASRRASRPRSFPGAKPARQPSWTGVDVFPPARPCRGRRRRVRDRSGPGRPLRPGARRALRRSLARHGGRPRPGPGAPSPRDRRGGWPQPPALGPPGSGKTMLARRLPGILPAPAPRKPSRPRPSTRRPASCARACSSRGPSAARTTRRARPRSWAAVPSPGRERSAWPTTASSSWTSCPSSAGPSSKPSVSPSRRGSITLSRVRGSLRLPARFQLVAAMNPCPCGSGRDGLRLHPRARPAPTPARLSGPLLDRIDLQVEVGAAVLRRAQRGARGSPRRPSRSRVEQARCRQAAPADEAGTALNAQLDGAALRRLAAPGSRGAVLLGAAVDQARPFRPCPRSAAARGPDHRRSRGQCPGRGVATSPRPCTSVVAGPIRCDDLFSKFLESALTTLRQPC